MHLYCERLPGWSAPADAFVTLYANEPYSFWLDREHSLDDRFSVIGDGGAASLDDLERIDDELDVPFGFRPGLVGAISYEGEELLVAADRALVFDHSKREIWFVGRFSSREGFEHWFQAALLRLALVGGETAAYKMHNAANSLTRPVARHEPLEYLQLIEAAQKHIAAGDVYQVCLTNELVSIGEVDSLYAFLRLREANPTPYAAYLRHGAVAVACSSPEQFLRVSASGLVSTKPIKGTRRRSADAVEDDRLASELAHDPKERAENLMIVDLMRNDLGRVCEPQSVSVPSLFAVETYATVHQLVSSVTGQLGPGKSSIDAVQAAFPGGSMTGAPKLRAMEIIEALEAGERGVYSGVLGYFGADGSADLGMVIRSVVFKGNQVRIGVGGGITADSEPLAEVAETQLKAGAMLAALGLEAPESW